MSLRAFIEKEIQRLSSFNDSVVATTDPVVIDLVRKNSETIASLALTALAVDESNVTAK